MRNKTLEACKIKISKIELFERMLFFAKYSCVIKNNGDESSIKISKVYIFLRTLQTLS